MEQLKEAAKIPLRQSFLGQQYAAMLSQLLRELVERCDNALIALRSLGNFQGYIRDIQEMAGELKKMRQAFVQTGLSGLQHFWRLFAKTRASSVSNDVPNKSVAKKLLDDLKNTIFEGLLKQLLSFNETQWRQGIASTLPSAQVLMDLVDQFSIAYADA